MDEDAMKDVPRKEKKIKSKSKKGVKIKESSTGTQESQNIKESSTGTQESQNISAVDATEHVRATENDGIAEMKNLKKNKAKKIKESKETEPGIKKGLEGELIVAHGKDSSEDPTDNVQRKAKKREKNKTSHSKEVEENDGKNGDGISEMKNTKDASTEKKNHKVKRKLEDVDFEEGTTDGKEYRQNSHDGERKKRKKEKQNSRDDSSLLQKEKMSDNGTIELSGQDGNDGKKLERKKKKDQKKYDMDIENNSLLQIDQVEHANKKEKKKKKKKHTELIGSGSDGAECEEKEKTKKTKPVVSYSNDASPNKSNKKVRFSGQDEVFTIPANSDTKKKDVGANSNTKKRKNVEGDDLVSGMQFSLDDKNECVGEDGLIRGKRFSPEEDETIKEAVSHYIDKNHLGDEGLEMVLNCKKHPKVRGCWVEIGSCIPYRPHTAVYYRAQVLYRRSETRKWTQEEYDLIRSHVKEHGNEWKALADELGKHRVHVKDTWRRIKLNQNKGRWSQDEYQKLFNLVNLDLQAKVSEEKRSKHGMLKDNICWTAISDELSTRSQDTCCVKWYNQLTSRMVIDKLWDDTDDYRLIDTLYGLDASCMEDVDWDSLLENRTGELCRKRWGQMVLHIGDHRNRSFSEQVELLAQRYCPILLKAREIWDSKPRVG